MSKQPFLGIPPGEVKTDNPDGVTQTQGFGTTHSLYNGGLPPIQSGDWQTRQVPTPKGNAPSE